jgi:hypothetical protein
MEDDYDVPGKFKLGHKRVKTRHARLYKLDADVVPGSRAGAGGSPQRSKFDGIWRQICFITFEFFASQNCVLLATQALKSPAWFYSDDSQRHKFALRV